MAIEEFRLRALHSWIHSKDIPVKDVVATSLMTNIFSGLSSQDCFEISCDLICEIVFLATREPRDMALVEHIYNLLTPLNDTLSQSLDDCFKVKDICRVFVEAGESYVDLIVSSPQHFEKLLDGILILSDYDFLDVPQITFNFWHTLTDQLLLNAEAMKNPLFFSMYDRLVGMIIKHLKYPADFGDFSAAERDEFREFRYLMISHTRHAIGDVLKDCVRILGETVALGKPFEQIMAQMNSGETNNWQAIEAPLFSLRAMCIEVSLKEATILPQIMTLLPQLPQHPKIRYAVILVMGRYAEWTNNHPELIQYQLQYVSAGFEDKESVAAAAQTFKDLCKFCSKVLYYLIF